MPAGNCLSGRLGKTVHLLGTNVERCRRCQPAHHRTHPRACKQAIMWCQHLQVYRWFVDKRLFILPTQSAQVVPRSHSDESRGLVMSPLDVPHCATIEVLIQVLGIKTWAWGLGRSGPLPLGLRFARRLNENWTRKEARLLLNANCFEENP